MSKEGKPLEYQPRIVDTKGAAQRIDLEYVRSAHRFRKLRTRITFAAGVVSVAGVLPFVFGLAGGRKILANGPVSRAHAVFEKECAQCHSASFSAVPDAACKQCHDGPTHPAKVVDRGRPSDSLRCGQCHIEHRGRLLLVDVSNGNCTRCHSDLTTHGSGVTLRNANITSFEPRRHPDFPAPERADTRPLRLNHAIHMSPRPRTVRGIKLPMQCSDCHETDRSSAKGDLLPVTFDRHCRSCHNRELEFDVHQRLGAKAAVAPHTKDPATIHTYIRNAYRQLADADPEAVRKPLGRDLNPPANREVWLDRIVGDSERYLFDRKCNYCHQYDRTVNGYPVVTKVNRIRGRYVEASAEGEAWLLRGEFSHRAHRAVQCSSCHRNALTSTRTADVLVARMESCTGCHGGSGTALDGCSQCHLYHNKAKEADKDRRPIEQLTRRASRE